MIPLETKEPSFEIYGSLIYIGLDSDNNVHLIIKKLSGSSKFVKLTKLYFEGREVKIKIGSFKRINNLKPNSQRYFIK